MTLTELVRDLRAVGDPLALWRISTRFFTSRGVDKVSYHRYRGIEPGNPQKLSSDGIEVNAEGFARDWVCEYIQKKLYTVDPIPELARMATVPVFWSEAEILLRLSAEQKDYLALMAEAGVGEGLAIFVYGPNMRNAYVGLGFGQERPALTAAQITELQCAAQMAHLRRCELIDEENERNFDLSPREREILHWIARGKSNAAIAVILDISPHTIDTLVRRLFDKLQVSDRTSAAIRGVGSGLVLPG